MASWISWGCSSGSEYLTESPVNIVPPIHRKTAHNSVHTTQYWYYCSRNLCTKKYRDISQSLKHASFIQRSNPSNAVILVGFIDRPMSSTLARSQRSVDEFNTGSISTVCRWAQHWLDLNGMSMNPDKTKAIVTGTSTRQRTEDPVTTVNLDCVAASSVRSLWYAVAQWK